MTRHGTTEQPADRLPATAIHASPSSRIGVDTTALAATLDAVRSEPSAGQFQLRVRHEWLGGTHSRSTIADYFGVGVERAHEHTFVIEADHPTVLAGRDHAPSPVEFVLHALASCITASLVTIAATSNVSLTGVRSTVTGDIDVNGSLGLDGEVRTGLHRIGIALTVSGDASPELLRALVESARDHSPVFDVVTNGAPISISIDIDVDVDVDTTHQELRHERSTPTPR